MYQLCSKRMSLKLSTLIDYLKLVANSIERTQCVLVYVLGCPESSCRLIYII